MYSNNNQNDYIQLYFLIKIDQSKQEHDLCCIQQKIFQPNTKYAIHRK